MNRFLPKAKWLILVIPICFFSFKTVQNDKYFEILKNLDIFATMFKEVNANYVDDINPNLFIEEGIDAMLSSLDPYTVYYPEDQIEDARTENTGQFGGIGAIIGERLGGKVMVIMPNEGFAADRAGLKRGDEIVSVQGVNVQNDYDKASQYLKGQADSKFQISVLRKEEQIDFEVELEKIELPNVPYYGMVTEDVGIIKLKGFGSNAGKEVKSAFRALKKEGAEKIIIDLRGNLGGLLNEAVNLSNIFIDKGELVVTTKGKLKEMNATYKTLNASTDTEIPIAVLINSSSASASEIVAGVMQDYDRGIVIGQKSFGKGLVQRTLPLSYNSQMKVTIAKYYTPSGRCIQAIDYSTRNQDGSVGKIADSLKTEFRTQNGRAVYDGGGVDPDYSIPVKELAPVTAAILENDLFFQFFNETQDLLIEDARAFELPKETYNQFVEWMSDKDLSYNNSLQLELEAFKASAQNSNQFNKLKSGISSLESMLKVNIKRDIEENEDEITYFLKEEAVMRSLMQKGQIEASFEIDQDLAKALEVLNNSNLYNETLAGQ